MNSRLYAPPALSMRFIPVWRRHFLVWRKLALPSILGNLADPLIMLFGLGYGLGAVMGEIGGTSYFAFLAAGFVASSTMYAATFGLFLGVLAHARQKTWEACQCAETPRRPDRRMGVDGDQGVCRGRMHARGDRAFGLQSRACSRRFRWWFDRLEFGGLGLVINALASGYDFLLLRRWCDTDECCRGVFRWREPGVIRR